MGSRISGPESRKLASRAHYTFVARGKGIVWYDPEHGSFSSRLKYHVEHPLFKALRAVYQVLTCAFLGHVL